MQGCRVSIHARLGTSHIDTLHTVFNPLTTPARALFLVGDVKGINQRQGSACAVLNGVQMALRR